jgi:hypothetical protein
MKILCKRKRILTLVVQRANDGGENYDSSIIPVRSDISRFSRGTVDSPTRIIFLTGIEDSSFQQAAMEAGGQAYVFKSQLLTDLPRAITTLMTGARFLSSKGKL